MPVCGEDVPRNARACPQCGADEKSGWAPDAQLLDALDLPDEEFDYEDFVKKEFGGGSRSKVPPAGGSGGNHVDHFSDPVFRLTD